MNTIEDCNMDPDMANMYALGNCMIKFNGLNYADWSEMIQLQLLVMDLDLALIMDERPPAITKTNTDADKSLFEAWYRSNRLSLNLMRLTMAENVRPSMPKTNDAREFMKLVREYSQSDITDKLITNNLASELTNKKFDWSQPIHDHVTEMSNLAAKLKSMRMEVNYNTLEEKWNLQEVKAMLIQEEGD